MIHSTPGFVVSAFYVHATWNSSTIMLLNRRPLHTAHLTNWTPRFTQYCRRLKRTIPWQRMDCTRIRRLHQICQVQFRRRLWLRFGVSHYVASFQMPVFASENDVTLLFPSVIRFCKKSFERAHRAIRSKDLTYMLLKRNLERSLF